MNPARAKYNESCVRARRLADDARAGG